MTKACEAVCDLLTRLDSAHGLNADDAEVLLALIHGLHYSDTMRSLLHGLAAGIQAYFMQSAEAATDAQEPQ